MAFELSQITDINFKLDQIGADQNIRKQYQPQINALQVIRRNQTATLDDIVRTMQRVDKNYEDKVIVHWLTADNMVVEPVEPNCVIDGPLLDSNKLAYDLDKEFKTDFSINQDDAKNHIFTVQEQVAFGFMNAFRLLDEENAEYALAQVDAYKGVNQYPGPYGAQNAAGNTVIPAADYNVKMVPYLIRLAMMNRINNYYLLDSGELFTEAILADAGNTANGIAAANMYNRINLRDDSFDLINFIRAGLTTDTLLVDTNSLYFATKTRYQNNVPQRASNDRLVYTRQSPFSGITYDVIYQEKCIVNPTTQKDETVETFRIQAKSGLLRAPEKTFPSVLGFEKGA